MNQQLVDTPTDNHLKKTTKRAILNDLKTCYINPFAADLLDKSYFTTAKRACLNPENVNMLVFLSQNLD